MLKDKTVINIVTKFVDKDADFVRKRDSKFNTAITYIFLLERIYKEFKICISANSKKSDVIEECKRVNRLIFDYEIRNAMASEEY